MLIWNPKRTTHCLCQYAGPHQHIGHLKVEIYSNNIEITDQNCTHHNLLAFSADKDRVDPVLVSLLDSCCTRWISGLRRSGTEAPRVCSLVYPPGLNSDSSFPFGTTVANLTPPLEDRTLIVEGSSTGARRLPDSYELLQPPPQTTHPITDPTHTQHSQHIKIALIMSMLHQYKTSAYPNQSQSIHQSQHTFL